MQVSHNRMRIAAITMALTLVSGLALADQTTNPEVKTKPEAKKPASEKKPSTEDTFAKGRDALFRGQYNEAITLLRKAVAAEKGKTSYRLHLARAYHYAGKDKQAAIELETIRKTSPDHVEAGQLLGQIYSKTKEWKKAIGVLEPLLKYRHDYPTYHMLAEAQYNLDQPEKAQKYYEEAIKLNPKSAADHYALGNIYLSSNFFALAAESYRGALRLGLDSPVLRYKLGSAYFNLRNYFGRISVQTIRSGKEGTIHGQWYLIERVPGSKDRFRCAPDTSAVYQIAKAVADGIEDRVDIHVLQATIYLNARRYAQAYKMFNKIGDSVPKEDKALFYYYHAQAALGTGRYDEYLKLLREAIRLDETAYKATLVSAYIRVADQYNQAGNLNKYIQYLELAIAESPQIAAIHLKLGDAYKEIAQPKKAIAQWRMVLDIESDHPRRMELLNLIKRYSTPEKQ